MEELQVEQADDAVLRLHAALVVLELEAVDRVLGMQAGHAEPALDSAGLRLEKFLSVWVQGEGDDDKPTLYTSLYVRTATLDFNRRAGFLQPLQGRTHQIKQMLTPGQKNFLRDWLSQEGPAAWTESDEHFRALFDPE